MGRPSSAVTMVSPSPPRETRGKLQGEFVRNRDRRPAGVRLQWLVWPLDGRGDDPADEVDVLGAERCRLSKPQPGVSAEQDRGTDACGYGAVQSPDLFGGCDIRPLFPCARRCPAGAGIARNDAVMDGVAEELRETSVEGVDVRVGPSLSLELSSPAADV
jgi:hypothetical protein